MTYLDSEQIINSADDDVDSGSVSSLCPQIILEFCMRILPKNHQEPHS